MNDQEENLPNGRSTAVPLIAVVTIHVAVLAIILASSPVARRFVELPDALVMILLPEPPSRPETSPPKKEVLTRPRAVTPEKAPPDTRQPSAAPAESSAPAALPPIDWQEEMKRAATKKADATPWQSTVTEKPKRKTEFGWSHAHTHRIEHSEDGPPVLWLNDHCVLVAFLIPACSVGKIKPRGDLFEGMNDPDPPGSVPDAPK